MSYQALYRVWRPQVFSDLVGQEFITKTLKNALLTKLRHMPIYSAARGELGQLRQLRSMPMRSTAKTKKTVNLAINVRLVRRSQRDG